MPSPSGMNFLDELTSNLKRVSDLKILLSVVEHIYICICFLIFSLIFKIWRMEHVLQSNRPTLALWLPLYEPENEQIWSMQL